MLELGALPVERNGIRLGRGDLGARARHVELGDVAGAPAALGERERLAVRAHGAAHQRAFAVERAQREVGLRHFGLHQEARALQQSFARLRVEPRRVARLAQPAEEIDLVGKIDPRAEETARRAADAVDDAAGALRARGGVDLRRARRVGRAREGARLREPRRGDADAGVAAVGARDQLIERRIGERLPPFAARLCHGRGGDGEAAAFPEARRRRRQLLAIDLRQRGGAAREQQDKNQGQTTFSGSVHCASCFETGAAGPSCNAPPPLAITCTSPWCFSGRLPLSARKST